LLQNVLMVHGTVPCKCPTPLSHSVLLCH